MTSSTSDVNLLVLITVSERQAENLLQAMVQEHFYFTKIDSQGLVFQEPNLCLLVGLNKARLSTLLDLIREHCQPYQEYVPVQFTNPAGFPPMGMIEASAGGALVYALDVERFEQF
jgi:uncharacterized protein YaaQ